MRISLAVTGAEFSSKELIDILRKLYLLYANGKHSLLERRKKMTRQAIDSLSDEIVPAVPQQTSTLPQAKRVPAGTGTAYWGPGELMTWTAKPRRLT